MLDIKIGSVLDASIAGKLITGGWYASNKLKGPGMEILKRYRLICQGCGFRSRGSNLTPHGWMVPIDLKHPAFVALDGKSGTCLCPLCASALAVNWSVVPKVVSNNSIPAPGMLILLPHMTQVELSRLALHLISIHACRKVSVQTTLETAAINVDNTLIALNTDIAGNLPIYRHGEDAAFARALAMLPQEHYRYRDQIIGPLRWWPNMSFWREQGIFWMKSSFAEVHTSDSTLSVGV